MPVVGSSHTATFAQGRLVLLLDHREVGAGREHAARGALLADLAARLGAENVEARALPLADMLWVWREGRDEREVGREVLAGWAVERKTFRDLGASVLDGRYDEQKLRLLEAPGLDGVIYLVEGDGPLFGVGAEAKAASGGAGHRGFGQRLLHQALPPSTLSTTAAHTQLISGFHVMHATSTSHSVALLVALHGALRQRGPPGSAAPVSYGDFAERTRKSCHRRVFDTFGRMLRVIPNCGPEATEALVDAFPTPGALAAALRDCSDSDLLQQLKARRGGGRAGVSVSCLAACRELFVAAAPS